MTVQRPPLLARVLLKLVLPTRLHEPIAGDLEEQWHANGRRGYWQLAVRSIVDCWCHRLPTQDARIQRGNLTMRSLLFDARYGIRMMGRTPGFTLAAVLTLAIGIGATSAIFTLANVLSWKPLSYSDPSRVAFVFGHDTESGGRQFSLPIADYLDIRRQAQTLEQVTAYAYLSANLTGGDMPERVQPIASPPKPSVCSACLRRSVARYCPRTELRDAIVWRSWQMASGGGGSVLIPPSSGARSL